MTTARVPIVVDVDPSDRESFLVLLLLLGHPRADVRAVTVTPGTVDQVGLVRWALKQFDTDMPVGALASDSRSASIDSWHYEILGAKPLNGEAAPGRDVLSDVLGPDTTMLATSALGNLAALLWKLKGAERSLGRLIVSGGDVTLVDAATTYRRLVHEDRECVRAVLESRERFTDVSIVPHRKDDPLFDRVASAFAHTICGSWCRHSFESCNCECHRSEHVRHIMPCCTECPYCGTRVVHHLRRPEPAGLGMGFFCRGMAPELRPRPLRASLAAALALAPCGAEWSGVDITEVSDGWALCPCDESGVQIALDVLPLSNVLGTLFVSKWDAGG